jgi:peptidoglycan/LPS O-acetylase OafA/YrhL
LVYLGKVSYGVYIFHIPLFLILGKLISNYINNSKTILALFALFATLFLSTLSYYYFEKPILALKRHLN